MQPHRHNCADTGLTIIVAASIGAWLWIATASLQAGIEDEASKHAAQYADPSHIAVNGRCRSLAPTEQSKCITERREAIREGQRKEGDLEAQRIMAIWTRAMGIAAIIGMSVGILGVGLIYTTFRETKRGADEAFRNVEAFIEAERAILHIVDGGVGPSNIDHRPELIFVEVVNRGRAPARIVSMGSFKDGTDLPPQPAPRWTVIGPNDKAKVALFEAPSKDVLLSVDCWLDYRTIGTGTYRSHFNINVSWYVPRKDSHVISYPQWFVNTSNENGRPNDT